MDVEAEPVIKPVEDGRDGGLGGALAVRVLDAQQHAAALGPGVEPVEQGRARPADMQEARRRRREAGDDVGHGVKRSAGRAGAPAPSGGRRASL